MFQVSRNDNESTEKILKRFSSQIKSLKLVQKFRSLRYFSQKPTKKNIRRAAISREKYREQNRKDFF